MPITALEDGVAVATFLIGVYDGWALSLAVFSLAVVLLGRYAVVPYANHLVASLSCLHAAVASDEVVTRHGRRASGSGLDGTAIARLPCFVVARRTGGGGPVEPVDEECGVCLGDVEEGETVRALPCCRHAFHTRCVDTWLRLRPTCPLCRATFR